jgi:hypothetical protein
LGSLSDPVGDEPEGEGSPSGALGEYARAWILNRIMLLRNKIGVGDQREALGEGRASQVRSMLWRAG